MVGKGVGKNTNEGFLDSSRVWSLKPWEHMPDSQSHIRTTDDIAGWCISLLYYKIPQKITTRKAAQSFFYVGKPQLCFRHLSQAEQNSKNHRKHAPLAMPLSDTKCFSFNLVKNFICLLHFMNLTDCKGGVLPGLYCGVICENICNLAHEHTEAANFTIRASICLYSDFYDFFF